ncbi:Transcription factor TFIIIB component B''-like protein [Drosera capensis]
MCCYSLHRQAVAESLSSVKSQTSFVLFLGEPAGYVMDFDDLFSEPVVTSGKSCSLSEDHLRFFELSSMSRSLLKRVNLNISAAPVARKFLPKRKPPAKKASSVAAQPSVVETNKKDFVPAPSTFDQGNDISANKTGVPGSSAGADNSVIENQTLSNQDLGTLCVDTASVTTSKHIGSVDPVLATCTALSCVDDSSNVVESTQEDAGISPLVSQDDLHNRSTMVADKSEGYCVLPDFPPGASPSAVGVTALTPETSSVEDHASFEYVIFNNDDVLLEIGNLETEGTGAFSSQELVSANSGKRTHILHPKPKLCDKGANVADSVVRPQGTPFVQTEAQNISKDDHVLESPHEPDLPTPRFVDTVPIDPLVDGLLNTNHVLEGPFEVPRPDDAVSDDVQMGSGSNVADLGGLENLTSQNYQDEGFASTVDERNGTGNYSSKLRKRKVAQEFVHGSDTIAADDERSLDDEAIDVDENSECGYQEGETSRKGSPRQKPKESASENDKPARKRNKKAEVSDQSDKQPPKRLPHSTRRKRRTVTKSFLDMPDDQIDFETVAIRDLLIRADIKQRQANKQSTAVNLPTTDERGDNTMQDNPYDDYPQAFASNPVRGTDNNPSSSNADNHEYYNYHSYMQRTPSTRWSMQDTELFYQAVSQFGSDFSMIQQLFPDRTRHQIKLKYKKEERQHPMRLFDALTNRAKDLSQFELVIEKLQERAAQEEMGDEEMNQGTQQGRPVNLAGDEGAESYPETNAAASMEKADFTSTSTDEPAKSEQNEESIAADEVQEEYPVESPAEDYDFDDEALRAYTEAYS